MIRAVAWRAGAVVIIDQRRLPDKLVYRRCRSVESLATAIETLAVRGAPLIGIAAAYGVALAARRPGTAAGNCRAAIRRLARTRPTAVNLFRALDRMAAVLAGDPRTLRRRLLAEARRIHAEDARACRLIAAHGATLLSAGTAVLTHCNAGALATGGVGTALGVIREARRLGKIGMVYADETRPLLQGARLTAWELKRDGVPLTLICDNMAASLMGRGTIGAVIVGADRIAANGDTANKTGSYGLAVLARHHGIPFYVAAPTTTLDFGLETGPEIPIEQRHAAEVNSINGTRLAPDGICAYNPSFDVVPAELITAIITERGVIRKPSKRKLLAVKKLL